ncbi:hypothetical protein JCM10207_001414, partial [Rhodosporidiobolus poonsookiae]
NFGACLRDCSSVLSHAPSEPTDTANKATMKALLRSGRALLALDKLAEAQDALERLKAMEDAAAGAGVATDSGKRWRDEVQKKREVKERKERERREKDRRKMEGDAAMVLALSSRGVQFPTPTAKAPLFHSAPTDVTPPHFDLEVVPLTSLPSIPLLPPSSSTASSDYTPWQPPPPETPLIFPVFLLQPLASPPTRDLIMAFPEDASFGDALASMGHDAAALQLYLGTARGRVLKIGSKLTLGKVLAAAGKVKEGEPRDGWALQEGWALEMVGVPKGEEGEKWVQGWKAELQQKASGKAIL